MTTYLKRTILVENAFGMRVPFHRNVTVKRNVATVQYRGETRLVLCTGNAADKSSVWKML